MSNLPNWIKTADDLKEGCEKYIREYGLDEFKTHVLRDILKENEIDFSSQKRKLERALSKLDDAEYSIRNALEELS